MSFRAAGVPSDMLLTGKNAVVYGGGGSIGGAVARAFAREGAEVFLAGRTAGEARSGRRGHPRRGRHGPHRGRRRARRRRRRRPRRDRRPDRHLLQRDHPQRRPGHADGGDGRRGLPRARRHRRAHELPDLEGGGAARRGRDPRSSAAPATRCRATASAACRPASRRSSRCAAVLGRERQARHPRRHAAHRRRPATRSRGLRGPRRAGEEPRGHHAARHAGDASRTSATSPRSSPPITPAR